MTDFNNITHFSEAAGSRRWTREAFHIASDMEDDVAAAKDFAVALAMMGESVGEGEGSAIQRLARAIEDRRDQLCRLLNPHREHGEN